MNEHEIGDVDCDIKMDFRLLVPNPKRGETDLMLAFIEVGRKRILKHPLCETFLFLKWHRIRKFFLFSLFYHTLFVMLFSMLIIGVYEKDCPGNHTGPEFDADGKPILKLQTTTPRDFASFGNISGVAFSASVPVEEECTSPNYVQPIGYLVIIMNFLLLAKEFFQMAHGYLIYIKNWENWVQILIILGVFLCAVSDNLKHQFR